MSNNRITRVPDCVGDLRQLQRLNLSGNKISALPRSLGQLKNLTILDIKTNEVSDLPAEIGDLASLTKFDLSHNMITELPWEMGQLNNLNTMDLTHNPCQFASFRFVSLELTPILSHAVIVPPKPIVTKGTATTIAWLRNNEKAGRAKKVSGLGLKDANA